MELQKTSPPVRVLSILYMAIYSYRHYLCMATILTHISGFFLKIFWKARDFGSLVSREKLSSTGWTSELCKIGKPRHHITACSRGTHCMLEHDEPEVLSNKGICIVILSVCLSVLYQHSLSVCLSVCLSVLYLHSHSVCLSVCLVSA